MEIKIHDTPYGGVSIEYLSCEGLEQVGEDLKVEVHSSLPTREEIHPLGSGETLLIHTKSHLPEEVIIRIPITRKTLPPSKIKFEKRR